VDEKVIGVGDLLQKFESLKTNVARGALRTATRKAAKIVAAEAESRAPQGTELHKTYKGRVVAPGFLSRNVKVKMWYDTARAAVGASIGVAKEAFYGTQFLEIGTSKIPKRPWLVPSLEAKRAEAERNFVVELRAAIDRAIKRGGTR